MPNTDLTGKIPRLPNINEETQFVKTDVYKVDYAANSAGQAGVHKLCYVPGGRMVVGIHAAVKQTIAGGATSANQGIGIGVSPNGSDCTNVVTLGSGTTITVSGGQVFNAMANGVGGMFGSAGGYVCLNNVGSATSGTVIVGVDTAPVGDYGENG